LTRRAPSRGLLKALRAQQLLDFRDPRRPSLDAIPSPGHINRSANRGEAKERIRLLYRDLRVDSVFCPDKMVAPLAIGSKAVPGEKKYD
jgi:hypothetical protein